MAEKKEAPKGLAAKDVFKALAGTHPRVLAQAIADYHALLQKKG